VENGAPTVLASSAHTKATKEKVMSNADPRGKFVWHELLSGDAAAATAFYTKVVPWKSQPWEQDSSYSMWVGKNGPVGGVAKLDGAGAAHWRPYAAVSDVAATAEAAKGLGGRVLKDKTDLPNGGSYAVLADPQGAEFAVYQSGGESGSNGSAGPAAGDFSWHELATTDASAAMAFYTKLLGWEAGPVHDMGPAGNYYLFLHEGNQYGGMFVSDGAGTGPSWLCYVSVEDVGKAATAAKNAGGRVMNGPMEVPGGSWIAQVLDAEGAAFAVHEPAKATAAQPAAKPEKSAKAPKPKAAKPAAAAAPAAQAAAAKPAEAKPAAKSAAKPAAKPAAAPKAEAAPAATKPAAAKSAAAKPAAAKPASKPAASKPAAAKPAAKAPAKAAAKKGKKAGAKKAAAKTAPARKAAKKAAPKGKAKTAAKKGKKVARKAAPAKKKSKAKAKKRR
jgi:predicted enzyme related to lactoylglutathione lyase